LTTGEQIAIGAVIISIISMAIAWRSYVLAKKTFYQNKKEHEEKYHEIVPYLIEGIKWMSDKKSFVSFALSYTNQATSPNSLKQVDLEIDYFDNEGIFNKAKLPPETGIAPVGLMGNYKQIDVPLYLNAKETASGWITYKLPLNNSNNIKIDVYRICALTPTEDKVTVETYLLRTASNEEK
jgi:hypothetical protein